MHEFHEWIPRIFWKNCIFHACEVAWVCFAFGGYFGVFGLKPICYGNRQKIDLFQHKYFGNSVWKFVFKHRGYFWSVVFRANLLLLMPKLLSFSNKHSDNSVSKFVFKLQWYHSRFLILAKFVRKLPKIITLFQCSKHQWGLKTVWLYFQI